MRKAITLFSILLILFSPCCYAESLFSGLLPATPIPAPTSTPAPTPAPSPSEDSSIPAYFRSDEVFEILGVPALQSEDGKTVIVFTSVDTEQFVRFINIMDDTQITAIHYDLHTETLTCTPVVAAPPKSERTASPKRDNPIDEDEDCYECGGLKKCEECWGEGELYCDAGCIGGHCIACDDGYVLIGYDYYDNPRYSKCSRCNYGDCKKCHGNGYYDCPSCYNGDCPACGGDGKR